MAAILYETHLEGGKHWSFTARRGSSLTLTDNEGGANVGMLFYNPQNLLERYNAPDTLKCQHTFKLTSGHCLYSDMGRIFCSIVSDTVGWHDTVWAIDKAIVAHVGQKDLSGPPQRVAANGHDASWSKAANMGLARRDLAANVNWFSKVVWPKTARWSFDPRHSRPGSPVDLRFEMDALVADSHVPASAEPGERLPAQTGMLEI